MRRKTVINYEVIKHLFDQNSEQDGQESFFRISGGEEPVTISIPASLMHRLFRLGQAYNIKKLRYLEPRVKLVIGSTEISDFMSDLDRLKKLVNDEVTHYYTNNLLSALNKGGGPTGKHIVVSTGDF
jgi:hypothetical protein